jgi:hypothetical protein
MCTLHWTGIKQARSQLVPVPHQKAKYRTKMQPLKSPWVILLCWRRFLLPYTWMATPL